MAKRGPKAKTAANSLEKAPNGIIWKDFEIPASFDAETRVAFNRLVEVLGKLGVLDRTDPSLVVATVRTQRLIEKAHAEIDRDGLTLTAANGTAMPHPMVGALNSLTMRLRGLLNDMGLTPASSKLTAPDSKGDANPWEGLLGVAG